MCTIVSFMEEYRQAANSLYSSNRISEAIDNYIGAMRLYACKLGEPGVQAYTNEAVKSLSNMALCYYQLGVPGPPGRTAALRPAGRNCGRTAQPLPRQGARAHCAGAAAAPRGSSHPSGVVLGWCAKHNPRRVGPSAADVWLGLSQLGPTAGPGPGQASGAAWPRVPQPIAVRGGAQHSATGYSGHGVQCRGRGLRTGQHSHELCGYAPVLSPIRGHDSSIQLRCAEGRGV